MHFQEADSSGPGPVSDDRVVDFAFRSSSLPFGQDLLLADIGGPTYLTAQTLIQQVAYTLSDKVFTYSPETFDLDIALRHWQSQGEKNAYGYGTGILPMETRRGAASIALGYIFSKDFDLKKRHIPQQIIASSATLRELAPALDELTLLYDVASPVVVHVAALDYKPESSSGFGTDYVSALVLADQLGLGLVSSGSAYEVQHMSLFATLLATVVPTIHIYDGIHLARETTRIVDVMDRNGLHKTYSAVSREVSSTERKHLDNEGCVTRLLEAFNDELGTQYRLFEYHGHHEAKAVLVVFGSSEAALAKHVVTSLAAKGMQVGVINVRVYRPFVEEEFLAALPRTAQRVAVLGQVKDAESATDSAEHSALYADVLAAVTFDSGSRNLDSVVDIKYGTGHTWTLNKIAGIISQLSAAGEVFSSDASVWKEQPLEATDISVRKYTFWDADDSPSAQAPVRLAQLLGTESTRNVSLRTGHDNLRQGGVLRTDICCSSTCVEAAHLDGLADLAFVGHEKLLREFDILNNLKHGGSLIVRLPGAYSQDLEKRFTVGTRKAISAKKVQLFVLDPSLLSKTLETPELEVHLIQLAFLEVAGKDMTTKLLSSLATTAKSKEILPAIAEDVSKALRRVDIPESWATIEPEVESISLPTNINVNSFSAFERTDPEPPNLLTNWVTAAKGLTFKEAYGTSQALRPDLPIKTAVVHVKERRRLTPLTYDRNIFHIEFDLGDSGLTYAIGEALGIHAENDTAEVEQFIKWYGLDPDEIVEVPTREDSDILENRTVYQALIQNVDIFGRPPKRFYETLSAFASDEKEKQNLLALSTAAGATEFKRRAEVDTITFADVLLEFPSAHPSFHDIMRIVSPMKRREYSIASSQKVTPNSVSLLIVTVNWTDPKGRSRYGQATRYLNALVPGSPVTVSVKPSVMKLPHKTTAPIIMAGLGTGLAPFRAFVQERALQKQQGEDIGAVLLYMGSRHQKEEYLYGEEWEAYQQAGVITLLGRAFSRDQPQKVYIQDRMRQTLDEIRQAYLKEQGSFYLCGPTWPVPDVTQVLQEAVEAEARGLGRRVDSRKEIEMLKEQSRYVLEVY